MTTNNEENVVGQKNSPLWGKLTFGIAAALATFVPGFIGLAALAPLPFTTSGLVGFVLGSAIGHFGFSYLVPQFFVRTNEAMKFVASSPYKGLLGLAGSQYIVFDEGTVHWTAPFMGRSARGNIPQGMETIELTFAVPGKDSELFFEVAFQYTVDQDKPVGYMRLELSTIKLGLTPRVEKQIAARSANRTLNTATKLLDKLGKEITSELAKDDSNSFEKQYFLKVKAVIVKRVRGSKEVMEARDGVAQAGLLKQSAATMLGRTVEELDTAIKSGSVTNDQLMAMYQLSLAKTKDATLNTNVNRIAIDGIDKGVSDVIVAAIHAFKGTSAQNGNGGNK